MATERAAVVPVWTVGDRLRKARSLTGLTSRAFAERIGVSHGTVTNAENDKVTVRTITLNAWALATGVSVQWLQTGVGSADTWPSGAPGYTDVGEDTEELRKLTASKRSRAGTSDKRWYLHAA